MQTSSSSQFGENDVMMFEESFSLIKLNETRRLNNVIVGRGPFKRISIMLRVAPVISAPKMLRGISKTI